MSFTTLVDVATLAAHLGDREWGVIDVRHQLSDVGYGERAYSESHIPGAVFLHCDRASGRRFRSSSTTMPKA